VLTVGWVFVLLSIPTMQLMEASVVIAVLNPESALSRLVKAAGSTLGIQSCSTKPEDKAAASGPPYLSFDCLPAFASATTPYIVSNRAPKTTTELSTNNDLNPSLDSSRMRRGGPSFMLLSHQCAFVVVQHGA